MADIDVVRKGSRAWVWILTLAILTFIVWFVMAGTRPSTTGHMHMGGQPHHAAAFLDMLRDPAG